MHSPVELRSRDLVAFSYYYDRALEADLIPPTGGRITVQAFTQVSRCTLLW
jgi:hypothetical protein